MLTLAAASIITCLSLSAVDGDTIKCNGRNMRLLEAWLAEHFRR